MAAGNLLRSSTSVTNILSQGHHPLSATVNSHLYQSVVGQLAQSPRALQQAVQQPHQLVGSAGSAIPDQSPLPVPGTPSPGSSSASTGSGSGSGKSTDTIKRGASPSSVKHVKIQESSSSYSISPKKALPKEASSLGDEDSFKKSAFSSTATATTTRKGVDFYEPHKSSAQASTTTKDDYGSKQRGYSSTTSTVVNGNGKLASSSNLSTDDYKAMRNKSSATSSSSSSQATVMSAANSTATSATTTSSDDSDDLISYKSSASTNALLAQSQAMTTSQLMSKYLKREPRVQFTPMKSPDSPSPPGNDSLPKGTYHLTSSSNRSTSLGAIGKCGTVTSVTNSSSSSSSSTAPGSYGTTETNISSSHKVSSPSRQISSNISSETGGTSLSVSTSSTSRAAAAAASSSSASSNVSSGRWLFESLASEGDTNKKSSSTSSTSSLTQYNDTKGVAVASSSVSNKQPSSEHKSHGSSLFGSNTNGTHNAMHLYGTLPKNGIASGNVSSVSTSSSAYNSMFHSGSSSTATASSSGVSSMTGSTSSYDYYTNSSASCTSMSSTSSTNRSYANGTSNGAGNYHTLGTYRVQYAATNPFLDAFEAPTTNSQTAATNGATGNGSNYNDSKEVSGSGNTTHRSTLLAAFHSSESKSGSDEYDDLK